MGSNNLFSEFPPVSRDEWEKQIEKDLKGEDYKEKLFWNTLEDFGALPFYRKEDLDQINHQTSGPVKSPASWQICEPVYGSDPKSANSEILKAIAGGADSVTLLVQATANEGLLNGNISGTHLQSQEGLKFLFTDVNPSETSLFFDSGMLTPAIAAMLKNHAEDFTDASLLFDPFTYIAKHGRLPVSAEQRNSITQQLVDQSNYRVLAADGLAYRQAGATIVQEIGISLTIASEYLANLPPEVREKAAKHFFVRLSAGSLYFPEIAKFRAVRLLWKQLLNAYNISDDIDLWIDAQTTSTNKTAIDPHSNILRATTEAMAAILGGANRITIRPYDQSFQQPDSFSKRISRNIHHILSEEAYLGKVNDPSAGSYYIETLTDTIAKKSWEFFRLIEKQGGFVKALENRIIQSEINSSRQKIDTAYTTRKKVLIGANQYPDPEAEISKNFSSVIKVDSLTVSGTEYQTNPSNLIESLQTAFERGAYVGDVLSVMIDPGKVLYRALPEYRAGKIFEEIRLKTMDFTQKTGRAPSVCLVPAGSIKWRNARSEFIQNFLGCAGFKINRPIGFEDLNEAAEQLNRDEFDIFVLCSSDEEYAKMVKPFCSTFLGNKTICILAGNPGDNEEDYRRQGIDFFIYKGINQPEILSKIQLRLFKTEDLS
ncbi:MAG: methylmalonyl-CoA mutase subunit beta [Balneolaceae bacterium]